MSISENVKTVYGSLVSRGVPAHVAAGLTGNIMQESSPVINPMAVGDGGNAFGIAQWNGPRRKQFMEFSRAGGKDPRKIESQIDFMLHELETTERAAKDAIWKAPDAETAALVASDKYWRPGTPMNENRVKYTNEVYAQLGDGSPMPTAQQGFTRDQLMAEARKRGLIPGTTSTSADGFSREELIAEAVKRGLVLPEEKPEAPGFIESANKAVRSMIADVNAGFQGVNPVGVSQSQPLGKVIRKDGKAYREIDGTLAEIKPETFKNHVTQYDPKTGEELLYQRTPEMEDPAAASVGRVLGYGVMGGPGQGVRSAARAAPKGEPAATMQTFQNASVTPSLGMMGPAGARAAGVMEGLLPTAGQVTDDAARAMGEVRGALGRAADTVGAGSGRVEAGNALLDGANDFLRVNLKGTSAAPSTSQRLYSRVDRMIPSGTMIDATEVSKTLQGFVERFSGVPDIAASLGQGKWQKWLDNIAENGGKLTWEQARELRTAVGGSIGKLTGPMADTAGGELKQVYSALSKDLDAAATAVGAGKTWKNANNHYRWASEQVKEALDIMFKAKSPEAAHDAFLALGKTSGRSANLDKLRLIKRALPEDEWSTVVASTIRKMGEAAPGGQGAAGDAFSASKFLTDWNKISSGAKDLLFTGKGIPNGLKAELDALATMMERAKLAERQINNSRSGSVTGNLMATGGLYAAGGAGYALAGAIGANLTARMLTSPATLRALRNYIAKGGNRAAARTLLESAGENRALLSDIATIIRLEKPEQPSALSPVRIEQ